MGIWGERCCAGTGDVELTTLMQRIWQQFATRINISIDDETKIQLIFHKLATIRVIASACEINRN
ncbi:hypothetical protein B6N60_00891 [Richelia sinica FACHB-800]|uniref:Uncharacterized protein n=1 Tax=Richelia sinica FACHB-800 TaxID=1357546 RepID=A0A975T522_9NOST|nr:hypothetical protein B6N60_00891 [Richelia sinica FACHB-800]